MTFPVKFPVTSFPVTVFSVMSFPMTSFPATSFPVTLFLVTPFPMILFPVTPSPPLPYRDVIPRRLPPPRIHGFPLHRTPLEALELEPVIPTGISNIWIEANDAQIRKRQRSRNGRDICIIFLQEIDKQLLLVFEYLTLSLDKISNKKNYFENDESF